LFFFNQIKGIVTKVSPQSILGFLFILVVSFYTYIPGYQKPAALFWDENFHVASAQRYLNNVFFLEPHPPLGKLLMAAGEFLFKTNKINNQFITKEKADDIPNGFSFAGYRFFPVIFGALIAPLLYIIILIISNCPYKSFLIALAPTFDNAMIVHSRGAMLESTQIFLILLCILFYLIINKKNGTSLKDYIYLGIFCGLSLTVKINSLPILLLPTILLFKFRNYFFWFCGFALSFIVTYLIIWQIHFSLSVNVNKNLDGNGFFGISDKYQKIVSSKNSYSPVNLFLGIKESFDYFNRYQKGVPTLDYSKDDENGSSPLLWPLGARTINYRWQQDGNEIKYLYLVANPISWAIGLLGVLSSIFILGSNFLSGRTLNLNLLAFSTIYFTTWLSPLLMNRVFYLYHYFVPLTFSWLMLGYTINSFFHNKFYKNLFFILTSFGILTAFIFYSPLTYYKPLSNKEISYRSLLKIWDLRCASCNSIYSSEKFSAKDSITNDLWKLSISTVQANYIEQDFGTPIQDNNNFEIQTNSKIQFPVNKEYLSLSGEIKSSQDKFYDDILVKIIIDGQVKWSQTIPPNYTNKLSFNLDIKGAQVLTLIAKTKSDNSPSVGLIWKNISLTK
jgi:dolichyl-phosphate-mannose-protein mannosyltransferase